jgi:PKD repeat protein
MRKILLNIALTVTTISLSSLASFAQTGNSSGVNSQALCTADFAHSVDNFGMVTFRPLSTDPNLYYNWEFGDGGTSGSMVPQHLYSNGSYKVCLNVFDGNQCNDYICKTVNVSTLSNPCTPIFTAIQSLSQSNTYTFALYNNCATSAWSYAWSFGDGTASAGVSPTHTFTAPGTYTVCASTFDSLGNAFTWCDNVVVPVILGVNENNAIKVGVYPNPAKDNITINNLIGNETIQLSTVEGRVVNEVVNGDEQKVTMDVNELPNGVYIMTVTGNKVSVQEKVMINK